jgi:translation initiation factor IF-3
MACSCAYSKNEAVGRGSRRFSKKRAQVRPVLWPDIKLTTKIEEHQFKLSHNFVKSFLAQKLRAVSYTVGSQGRRGAPAEGAAENVDLALATGEETYQTAHSSRAMLLAKPFE